MDQEADIKTVRTAFIERMGMVAHHEGMPRMGGQILAMLVFDGTAISFGDLARRLQVSRATISTSVRFLEERGLIRRLNRTGERQDYFQLAEDAYATMLRHARTGTLRAISEISQTAAELPAGSDAIRRRLDEYAGFYEAIDASILDAISRFETADT
ncbi:GbsR/MarR family transcriptional regulator [Oceaniglobus trochenteri]|uniref:GbsR/MarR family transcriptional regulator n=1 Tax=Oceaniglobus trochenteri TaxID=2763260 RepID=UPI001CFFEA11|nr:MarR family transcriptional regulator [Oceaniglobus trochenteri]